MPRVCTVCSHSQRPEIDRALVNGDTLRKIAERFSVSVTALHRHKKTHLPAVLAQAEEAHQVARAGDLLGQLESLKAEAHRIKGKAEEAGEYRTALTGIRELVRIVELMAKVSGELQEAAQTVNILVAPEWLATRATVVEALAPYPEARAAVGQALQGVDRAGR